MWIECFTFFVYQVGKEKKKQKQAKPSDSNAKRVYYTVCVCAHNMIVFSRSMDHWCIMGLLYDHDRDIFFCSLYIQGRAVATRELGQAPRLSQFF